MLTTLTMQSARRRAKRIRALAHLKPYLRQTLVSLNQQSHGTAKFLKWDSVGLHSFYDAVWDLGANLSVSRETRSDTNNTVRSFSMNGGSCWFCPLAVNLMCCDDTTAGGLQSWGISVVFWEACRDECHVCTLHTTTTNYKTLNTTSKREIMRTLEF